MIEKENFQNQKLQNQITENNLEQNDDIKLPDTIRMEKELNLEDQKKLKNQWRLFQELSSVSIPNDLLARIKAGLPHLTKGTLIHGTSFDVEKLLEIQKSGIISGELLGIPEDSETNYCADFFRVPENMSVKDYVAWSHQKEPQAPGSMLKIKRMESKFLAGNNNQISVIVNTETADLKPLLDMDAYTNGFEQMQTIITRLPIDRESTKAQRVAALLVGVPANFISGLILPLKVSQDSTQVSQIKAIFSDKVLIFDVNGNIL